MANDIFRTQKTTTYTVQFCEQKYINLDELNDQHSTILTAKWLLRMTFILPIAATTGTSPAFAKQPTE